MPQATAEEGNPAWFRKNIAEPCKSEFVDVRGASIHYLHWAAKPLTTNSGKAGLIFVHGNGAHAHWWAFLAPFFTREYECVAVSNSGNGKSGWRDRYTFALWAEECFEAARHCGMLDAPLRCKPVVVAHSMGVAVAMEMARLFPDGIAGLVLLDEVPRPEGFMDGATLAMERGYHVPRPLAESPRERFRLAPPQPHKNRFLLDYIADRSVISSKDGSGWVWSFDPEKMTKIAAEERFPSSLINIISVERVKALPVRTAFIVGSSSVICTPSLVDWARHELGAELPIVELFDAAHHVMFDQPLALVASIQAMLAEWRRSATWTVGGSSLPRLEDRASHSAFDGIMPRRIDPHASKL